MRDIESVQTRIPQKQILIGRYDGARKADFYRESDGAIRVDTERGVMWVTLIHQNVRSHRFDPKKELVLVFLYDTDSDTGAYTDGEMLSSVAFAFGLIVPVPTQYVEVKPKYQDQANMPTKIMGNSNSEDDDRATLSVSEDAKIVATKDMILLKSGGAQIAMCKDGIVKKGSMIDMSFFGDSKGGILKQNWIGNVIPQSVVTPFPGYLPDWGMIERVKGLADTIASIREGVS